MRKILASTAAGLAIASGAVALGAVGPVTAFAQSGQNPTAATSQAAPSGSTDGANGANGANGATGRHHKLRHKLAKAIVKDAADTIGIPAKDLLAALKGGQSIADVATAHGVDPQTVIDKLTTDAVARVDKAVADGKLTAERGEKIKAKVPERVTKIVNRHVDGSHKPAK